jgi:hypothetical protein
LPGQAGKFRFGKVAACDAEHIVNLLGVLGNHVQNGTHGTGEIVKIVVAFVGVPAEFLEPSNLLFEVEDLLPGADDDLLRLRVRPWCFVCVLWCCGHWFDYGFMFHDFCLSRFSPVCCRRHAAAAKHRQM